MSFRFHSDVLQHFPVFPHACLAETQFADGEHSWSTSVLSRENNCVASAGPVGSDRWAQLNPSQHTAVKITVRERCWHILNCLCRTPSILIYLRKDRVCPCYHVRHLTTGLRTDTVSCSLEMGNWKSWRRKHSCARNWASPHSQALKGCVWHWAYMVFS